MLTAREVQIVQEDWAKVENIGDAAATLFYDRVFELEPELRSLFKSDMAEQKRKLIRMIGAAVAGLSDPQVLMPLLRKLGKQHADLGVQSRDYATVGAALVWTLRQGLGAGFLPYREAAWIKVYDLLAEAMKGYALLPPAAK